MPLKPKWHWLRWELERGQQSSQNILFPCNFVQLPHAALMFPPNNRASVMPVTLPKGLSQGHPSQLSRPPKLVPLNEDHWPHNLIMQPHSVSHCKKPVTTGEGQHKDGRVNLEFCSLTLGSLFSGMIQQSATVIAAEAPGQQLITQPLFSTYNICKLPICETPLFLYSYLTKH